MKNGSQHAFDSGEDFLVPESHDGVTQRLEVPHAFDIGGDLLPVVFAVDFDDDPVSAADEVDDIPADWILASEVVAVEAVGSQLRPQVPLGGSGTLAEFLGGECSVHGWLDLRPTTWSLRIGANALLGIRCIYSCETSPPAPPLSKGRGGEARDLELGVRKRAPAVEEARSRGWLDPGGDA